MANIPVKNQCPCGTLEYVRFCTTDTVESEICLTTPVVKSDIVSVDVIVPEGALAVELLSCNLIVVCGFIRKTIIFTDASGVDDITVDIPVQINVPVNLNHTNVTIDDLLVTGAICNGCAQLVCKCPSDSNKFSKLVEKDIITIIVYNNPA